MFNTFTGVFKCFDECFDRCRKKINRKIGSRIYSIIKGAFQSAHDATRLTTKTNDTKIFESKEDSVNLTQQPVSN